MKKYFQYKSQVRKTLLFATLGLLILALTSIPRCSMAQRFSHGGGGGGGARMSAPAPRMSAPAPRQEAPRQESRPAPAPVVRQNVTINGGARNVGVHDFNRNTTVNVHDNVNVHENVNVHTNVNVHRDVTVHENVYHVGAYHGFHPYYYHPYRPAYWGPRWHPVGFFLASLAVNAFRFAIGSQYYYYDDGCYYIPSSGGYSVVPPPIGAVVSYLPQGYETTMVGNDTFYYYGGAFYVGVENGYQVVAAPVGAVVSQVPVGAVEQTVGDQGQTILVYNNTYYQPISQNGEDAYEVVQAGN